METRLREKTRGEETQQEPRKGEERRVDGKRIEERTKGGQQKMRIGDQRREGKFKEETNEEKMMRGEETTGTQADTYLKAGIWAHAEPRK